MRPWYKFTVSDGANESIYQPISESFGDHERDIGGYGETDAYETKQSYFERYYFGNRRIENYDLFIQKTLTEGQNTLSLGSGRCANELMLQERGYRVTCSDLGQPRALQATRRIFPQLEHVQLDILAECPPKRYDAILCLSVIYLFDDDQLDRFFKNVREGLVGGGSLIFDAPGSPDTLPAWFLHDILLKFEAQTFRLLRTIKRRRDPGLIRKHHGYRRTDTEILEIATANRFHLICQENYDFLTEFERSYVLRRLMNRSFRIRGMFERIGRSFPYARMYQMKRD